MEPRASSLATFRDRSSKGTRVLQGNTDMEFRESLEQRLEEKGLERHIIPGFMRGLAQALSFTPHASPLQVQKLMCSMGWNIADRKDG
jgi:hypothetical protein